MSDGPAMPDPESELHAFVDGELPPERHAAIAARIERDPHLRRRVQELRALDEAVGRLAGPLLSMPVPERLLRAASGPAAASADRGRARRRRLGVAAMALAASVAFAVLVGRDRIGHQAGAADPIVADALSARDRTQAPVRQVSFGAAADPAAEDRFVAAALGRGMRAPDLRRVGYTLVEADLYEAAPGRTAGRAVQLRYVDGQHHLFAVYVHPGAGPDRFALLRQRSVRICLWQNEDMSAVMSAELPVSALFRLSSMTYSALAL